MPQEISHPTSSTTIVAFGDSLTSGYGLDDPDAESWPAILEAALRAEGRDVRVLNSGVSGNTTFDAVARLEASVPPEAAVVIVALGANDSFQGKKLEDIEANLRTIVSTLKKRGTQVVLCGMKTLPNLGPHYAGRFEAIFPRVAEGEDALLVPFMLEGVAAEAGQNQSDGIHPNASGHRKIAETVIPYVRPQLTRIR